MITSRKGTCGMLNGGLGADSDGFFMGGISKEVVDKAEKGGWCLSDSCVAEIKGEKAKHGGKNYKYMYFNDQRVLKTRDKSKTQCPDCGHALYWDLIEAEKRRVVHMVNNHRDGRWGKDYVKKKKNRKKKSKKIIAENVVMK